MYKVEVNKFRLVETKINEFSISNSRNRKTNVSTVKLEKAKLAAQIISKY